MLRQAACETILGGGGQACHRDDRVPHPVSRPQSREAHELM
jgi:hypothetical protein